MKFYSVTAIELAAVISITGYFVYNSSKEEHVEQCLSPGSDEFMWRVVATSIATPLIIEFVLDWIVTAVYSNLNEVSALEDRVGHGIIISSLLPVSYVPLWLFGNSICNYRDAFVSLGHAMVVCGVLGKLETFSSDIWHQSDAIMVLSLFFAAQVSLLFGIHIEGGIVTYTELSLKLGCTLKLLSALVFLTSSRNFQLVFYDLSVSQSNFFTTRKYLCTTLFAGLSMFLLSSTYFVYVAFRNLPEPTEIISTRIMATVVGVIVTAVLPGRIMRRGLQAAQRTAEIQREIAYKKTFVRYVSHEVRSPLSTTAIGIDCILDILQNPHKRLVRAELLDLTRDCKLTCLSAVQTLSDLLLFDKIENNMLQVEKTHVSCTPFVEQATKPFARPLHIANLTYKVQIDRALEHFHLLVDPVKVEQVLRNFLANAVKFTSPGGSISVIASLQTRRLPVKLPQQHQSPSLSPNPFPHQQAYMFAEDGGRCGSANGLSPTVPSSSSSPSKLSPSIIDSVRFFYSSFSDRASKAPTASANGSVKTDSSTPAGTKGTKSTTGGYFSAFGSLFNGGYASSPAGEGEVLMRDCPVMRVEVIDTGAGITKENQAKLFQQYMQFDANKLQGGRGSGLGLWISKAIIDMHDGVIGASSPGLNCGSVFYFEVPCFDGNVEAGTMYTEHLPHYHDTPSDPTNGSPYNHHPPHDGHSSGQVSHQQHEGEDGIEAEAEGEVDGALQRGSSKKSRKSFYALPSALSSDVLSVHSDASTSQTTSGTSSMLRRSSSRNSSINNNNVTTSASTTSSNGTHANGGSLNAKLPRQLSSTSIADATSFVIAGTSSSSSSLAQTGNNSDLNSHGPTSLGVSSAGTIHTNLTSMSTSLKNTAPLSRRLRILIADDAALARKMIERLLAALTSSTVHAVSGLDAVEKVTLSLPYDKTANIRSTDLHTHSSTSSDPCNQVASMATTATTVAEVASNVVLSPSKTTSSGGTLTNAIALGSTAMLPFDVVIMDYYMPGMDGPEAMREIRHRGFTGIIVAVTAACSGDERDKLLQCGADFVMQKPFDLALFRAFMRDRIGSG